MPESFVQLAADGAGKMMRALSKTVGANTVYQQVVTTASARTRVGLYRGESGLLSVTSSADTATAGKLWLLNPVGSTTAVAIEVAQVSITNSSINLTPAVVRAVSVTAAAGLITLSGIANSQAIGVATGSRRGRRSRTLDDGQCHRNLPRGHRRGREVQPTVRQTTGEVTWPTR